MIEVRELSKQFQDIRALDCVTATIQEGHIFGLVGSNGAGKSTFLRVLSGVIKADSGSVTIDGLTVFENPEAKQKVCFLSDTGYFLPNATPDNMKEYYAEIYPGFDRDLFLDLAKKFQMDISRKINTFSKGMKKQLSVLLGVCTRTKYLLCDETFDGLDPVMRQAVKSLFAAEVMERDFTPVIASHNLRELEDICDHVGLLHKGGILFTKDLEEMKFHIHKIQCVMKNPLDEESILRELDVLKSDKRGSLLTVIARGTRIEILDCIQDKDPLFAEVLPLSLEEIFISETEVAGYDITDFLV
ncbi:MAG TPA: ABC transporter [Lachnospiraceae bacterium]|nr:ABC transporter [Lachnospiraceae bacterium]